MSELTFIKALRGMERGETWKGPDGTLFRMDRTPGTLEKPGELRLALQLDDGTWWETATPYRRLINATWERHLEPKDILWAARELEAGRRVRHESFPEGHCLVSKGQHTYIQTPNGTGWPWLPITEHLLGEGWYPFHGEEEEE